MKTHTIKTPTADLMIIETSEQIILNTTATGYMLRDNSTNEDFFIEGYTLLGSPDEIREEDAIGLVSDFDAFKVSENGSGYYNYKESLLSLLESEIFWDANPYGTRESNTLIEGGHEMWAYSDEHFGKWHEAEQKTFDRNRSIILVKN